jgi:pyruvate dehydrogenase (quinone)
MPNTRAPADRAGILVDDSVAVGPAWDEALAADRSMALDRLTDPNVPPLLPHVTRPQMGAYIAALLRSDADGGAIVRATPRDWWAGILLQKSEH